ncbi:MAG: UPF0175 family protein, partial [Methylococcaceae bacterium]
ENIITETAKKKQDSVIPDTPLNAVKIAHHSYSATLIFLMLQLVLNAAVSLRGSSRVLTIVNDVLGQPLPRVPSWFSVRSWLLRVGYYKLMRAKTIADDWCWIIDNTIQLGKTKCLLVLGIRLSEMPKGRNLQFQDLEPIELLPVEASNGEVVWQQLEKTAAKTGIPRAIVSDAGSDLKLGIGQFCAKHESWSVGTRRVGEYFLRSANVKPCGLVPVYVDSPISLVSCCHHTGSTDSPKPVSIYTIRLLCSILLCIHLLFCGKIKRQDLNSRHNTMQLTLEIPDQYIHGQNQSQIARQIKLYSALLMFQSGQLSRGAACEFAGVDIYDFFLACKQHQISAINTPVESIEADVSRFQHRHT